MVTIGMNYRVLPGKEEVFERAFKQVIEVMQSTAGHKVSFLYSEVDKSGSYLIVSEWNDQAAFDAFVKSDAFKRVTTWGKEQILSERPRHSVYTSST